MYIGTDVGISSISQNLHTQSKWASLKTFKLKANGHLSKFSHSKQMGISQNLQTQSKWAYLKTFTLKATLSKPLNSKQWGYVGRLDSALHYIASA
jgi:hypothetical protein